MLDLFASFQVTNEDALNTTGGTRRRSFGKVYQGGVAIQSFSGILATPLQVGEIVLTAARSSEPIIGVLRRPPVQEDHTNLPQIEVPVAS